MYEFLHLKAPTLYTNHTAGTPGKTPAEQSKPIMTSLQSDKYDTVMNEYQSNIAWNFNPLHF
jgi:hypothetical protein